MGYILPSKEEFLTNIRPGKKLTKDLLKKIYGYGVTDTDFSDKAIAALEAVGYYRARQYYKSWVNAYEAAYKAEIRPVAEWYQRECEKKWEKTQKKGEEGEEKRKWEETELLLKQKKLLLMKKSQILTDN